MKIWVLNNTKIDKNKNWEQYFNTIFIPNLTKYSKDGDIVLHLGHIFNNSDLVNIKSINKLLSLFSKISKLRPFYFLDGYDTELLKLIKNIKNTTIVDNPLTINNVKLIPKKFNIIEHLENDIIFINSQVEQSILEKYNNYNFYCGYYDLNSEHKNIINVGTPYQLNKNSSSGFYVVDTLTKKHKYFNNLYSEQFKTIRLTDIAQIEDLDAVYINDNNVYIEIDRSLITENKLKIDVLLNDFKFKSISYINENSDDIDFINNSSLNMEDLIIEKIKETDNENLMIEFKNILKLYKEKY